VTEFSLYTGIFFLLGLSMGSFLGLCIDRLPGGQSIVSPPSRCDNCLQRLKPSDLIPLVSYVWLRGRCRYCQTKIPIRTFLVELIAGTSFSLLYWHFGLTALLAAALVYVCVFILIFFIDLEHMLVLDVVVFPGMALALGFSFLPHSIGILNALEGGAVGLGITLAIFLIFRSGFGFGDVEIAALIGLCVGFPEIFVALFFAVVGGGVMALVLLLLRIKGRKDVIAFAPYFAIAAMVALVWGSEIVHWYQHGM
jgi:leader peptidase (prepilin peptidase)/N-methyltransferase